MNVNDVICGFRVDAIREVEEIKAVLYEMTHIQTDAKLIYSKRDDDNKTFAIAFKTIPSDSTGVFHILEHSVLNGSEKFPLKEPFVDLLKGSLQTFLNAMTYPDKTVYPVCSRNPQDFINLVRIYMDGVFNPMVKKNPNIFYQEGWHYELKDVNDPIVLKGVVYNEMKGAYSSAEELANKCLNQQLFPNTTYSYSSGGDPAVIPELTYENFCKAHDTYYNPTNSLIWLDGDMDIEKMLSIIDGEFLSNYQMENTRTTFEYQKPIVQEPFFGYYPVAEGSDLNDKTIVNFGYVYGDYKDVEKTLALNIIGSILTENNQSPLKKAILENNLAQDMYASAVDGTLQPHFEIALFNSNASCFEKIQETIDSVLKGIVKEGINKDEIVAYLNKLEFSSKERDFGNAPKGLVFGLQGLNSWLYGGDPVDSIVIEGVFNNLRNNINTSYYEDLISECILECKHTACVVMQPNDQLEKQQNEALREKLENYKNSLTDEQVKQLVQFNHEFSKWQNTEDSDEVKAMLPHLSLNDVEKEPSKIDFEEKEISGIKGIYFNNNTEGINYYNLFFNVDDYSLEDLQKTILASKLLGELNTENYDVLTFSRLRKSILGSLSLSLQCFENKHEGNHHSYMVVGFSCLDKNKDDALKLVEEFLYRMKFEDMEEIQDIFKQAKFEMEMGIVQAGHQVGINRVSASLSELGVTKEFTSGYEFYRVLKDYAENFNVEKKALLEDSYRKLFTSNRLTLAVMGDSQQEMAEKIIQMIHKSDEEIVQVTRPLLPIRKEGIVIASTVAYAEMGSNQLEKTKDIVGKMNVITKILSLDYLWANVRAKGGAYGSGTGNRHGNLVFYSYRDPNPMNSLTVYAQTEQYLKALCETNVDLDQYIIGSIGDSDPLLTNQNLMNIGTAVYFSGITYEDRCENRQQMLNLTKDDILEISEIYKQAAINPAVCVVGGKGILEKLELDCLYEL